MRTKCACNEGVATLIVSPYNSKDKSGGVCGWATSTQKLLMVLVKTKAGGAAPPYATGSLHASVGMGV